ncbi:MAG: LPS assembly lipoprotein LptE [Candidatus Cardinium sp.]|uniref:LPS assembly lipoprotein LptE n=1 Tax=Candidatus Cardinium sp. TP TaxID=2961955 RepID=UPI0021B06F85|nr:LPS assembly lipoprotein LptE [Candidatus Cardinium sp. TP]MCT4697157.1 LPS assembly lipoprotein LptE [Candidatus Cardinium sp. TP]MDN5247151.1 LPS assembly lipoprotein LptE [Candidatus Cardinium sp.]
MRLKSPILTNSLYLVFSLLGLHSCGLFTFLGTSLSPDVKTFSVQTFYTEVTDGPIDMPQKLTEALVTKISRITSLTREEKDGDIQYEGIIKSFSYTTAFNTKNEQGHNLKEVQRLTITIEVAYLNPTDEESSFKKKQFSASADMLSTENKLEKEPELIKEIFNKLVDDICSKSIDNW